MKFLLKLIVFCALFGGDFIVSMMMLTSDSENKDPWGGVAKVIVFIIMQYVIISIFQGIVEAIG